MTDARIRQALRKAIPHVQRQVFAGKHEQDRADAKAWLAEYVDLVDALVSAKPAKKP